MEMWECGACCGLVGAMWLKHCKLFSTWLGIERFCFSALWDFFAADEAHGVSSRQQAVEFLRAWCAPVFLFKRSWAALCTCNIYLCQRQGLSGHGLWECGSHQSARQTSWLLVVHPALWVVACDHEASVSPLVEVLRVVAFLPSETLWWHRTRSSKLLTFCAAFFSLVECLQHCCLAHSIFHFFLDLMPSDCLLQSDKGAGKSNDHLALPVCALLKFEWTPSLSIVADLGTTEQSNAWTWWHLPAHSFCPQCVLRTVEKCPSGRCIRCDPPRCSQRKGSCQMQRWDAEDGFCPFEKDWGDWSLPFLSAASSSSLSEVPSAVS